MERSGWIPGLVLMFLMSLANAFSVEVVFRLCRLTGRPTSLGEIGDKAPPLRTRPLLPPLCGCGNDGGEVKSKKHQ